MPFYEYSCSCGRSFEARGSYNDSLKPCQCGGEAQRLPFSPGVGMMVEGRVLITDPEYAREKAIQDLRKSGWDGDRAISHIRKSMKEDREGRKFLDPVAVNNA